MSIASEVPCTIDDAIRFRGEEVEESTRQVETAEGASRALVHDCCSGGLPVISHDNLLEAIGTGVSATELLNSQGQTTVGKVNRAKLHTGVLRATIKSLATLF